MVDRNGGGRIRRFFVLIRNLSLAALLYASIFGLLEVARNPRQIKGRLGWKSKDGDKTSGGGADIIQTTKAGIKVQFANSNSVITINPHANHFNRPQSAVTPNDGYLGARPHVDTEANIEMMVEECRGTYEGLEKMRNVFECLKFLEHGGDKYFSIPSESERGSNRDPRSSEYLDSDGHGNTREHYVSIKSAEAVSKDTIGSCSGPIVPYHTYWTGSATWRLEIFVKSWLYTQNLACSRLYIWLDEDRQPGAVETMRTRDKLFARFLPFVERGDITLKSWKFPQRIPLPRHEDKPTGVNHFTLRSRANAKGETAVGDGLIEDAQGQQWLVLTERQMTFLPQAVSDAVRFVVLHLYGGVYLDMDVLLLRDMRPLLIGKTHNFAERWGAHPHPGDYNTAILSLSANSSLSSYLLQGGVRMGLNFHPRIIGRMAWKDGRDRELLMLETVVFDPIWTEFNWDREGKCALPCFKDYAAMFKGEATALKEEWKSYEGPAAERIDIHAPQVAPKAGTWDLDSRQEEERSLPWGARSTKRSIPSSVSTEDAVQVDVPGPSDGIDSFTVTRDEEERLRKSGVILDYNVADDKFPPNNRTLEHFFRGAWSYHVHNQWLKHPEPSSWFSVMTHAHDGFFDGHRTNMYGEKWHGPAVAPYNLWHAYV